MEMQKGKRLKNDDSMLFKCPRALALAAERAAAEQMMSRSAWLRALVVERLRMLETSAALHE
jgi:hypothetical protein